jgi:hypothetical protein
MQHSDEIISAAQKLLDFNVSNSKKLEGDPIDATQKAKELLSGDKISNKNIKEWNEYILSIRKDNPEAKLVINDLTIKNFIDKNPEEINFSNCILNGFNISKSTFRANLNNSEINGSKKIEGRTSLFNNNVVICTDFSSAVISDDVRFNNNEYKDCTVIDNCTALNEDFNNDKISWRGEDCNLNNDFKSVKNKFEKPNNNFSFKNYLLNTKGYIPLTSIDLSYGFDEAGNQLIEGSWSLYLSHAPYAVLSQRAKLNNFGFHIEGFNLLEAKFNDLKISDGFMGAGASYVLDNKKMGMNFNLGIKSGGEQYSFSTGVQESVYQVFGYSAGIDVQATSILGFNANITGSFKDSKTNNYNFPERQLESAIPIAIKFSTKIDLPPFSPDGKNLRAFIKIGGEYLSSTSSVLTENNVEYKSDERKPIIMPSIGIGLRILLDKNSNSNGLKIF